MAKDNAVRRERDRRKTPEEKGDKATYMRGWYAKNAERVTANIRARYRESKAGDPESMREKARRHTLAYKRRCLMLVLAAYGGKCSCCGETEPIFLTIDHVNDDGKADRQKNKGRRQEIVVVRAGFPPSYRLQCYNCNLGRQRNGGICPHQIKSSVAI